MESQWQQPKIQTESAGISRRHKECNTWSVSSRYTYTLLYFTRPVPDMLAKYFGHI